MTLVAFLTDYGLGDPYVGLCHAAIAAEAPAVRVVDLAHDVDPHDVAQGALLLHDCVPYLPEGVLLAVVDPGVGTARRPVAVSAGGRWLVGPDNGLLAPAAQRLGGADAAWLITLRRPGPARTFDGRDVFAPAAARLALGADPGGIGAPVEPGSLQPLALEAAHVTDGSLRSRVVRRDRFGNLLLTATAAVLAELGWEPGRQVEVSTAGEQASACVAGTFAEVERGALALLPDAFGRLQLSVREGDAGASLRLRIGDEVRLGAAEG